MEELYNLAAQSLRRRARLRGGAVGLAGCALVVSHEETARIQEGRQFLLQALMAAVEAGLGL